MIKQVRVLEREFGPFDRVHVEMAREVGKSIDERSKIARGIDRRTAIKRNYLVMDATECEKQFRKRNLNDTRYALRIILGLLRRTYPDFEDGITGDGKLVMRRRVYARPGAVTSALRHVWGVESLKKDKNGERLQDDRHHALDAIITACCSERLLQLATRSVRSGAEKNLNCATCRLPGMNGTIFAERLKERLAKCLSPGRNLGACAARPMTQPSSKSARLTVRKSWSSGGRSAI